MMLEEEIEMLKAIIAEKEELHQCNCIDKLDKDVGRGKEWDKEIIQNLAGVVKHGVDTSVEEMEPSRRVGDSDSGSEGGVSDGELEWLEKDIGTMIAKEDPQAYTLDLLND